MVDDVPGVRAGHRVSVCSCAFGRAISARQPIRLKTAVWRSWSSSFSALPVAAPDPRSAFPRLRSAGPVQLLDGGDPQALVAAAHFPDAVVRGWPGWSADGYSLLLLL